MEHKKILVTGGTGSWGHELIRELLKRNVGQIKVYSRNEFQIVKLQQTFQTPKLETVIGDIRDRTALQKVCSDCDIVFHLAALKHVPICEAMPVEAIATNVIGTRNVIDCAMDAQVEKMIYVSTDKAVDVSCTYGCTKLLGEKLMLAAQEQSRNTKFMIFRGGNLLSSAGSVVPLFKKQISEMGSITLTDNRMTRFFLSAEKASTLLCEAIERSAGGEIFLPVMPSLAIRDVARYLLQKNGLGEENIKIIGIRPGEKLHEQMLEENEVDKVFRLTDDLVIVSHRDIHGWAANGFIQKSDDYPYQSEKAMLTYDQTEKFLRTANI